SEPVRAWLVEHRDRFGTVALDAHDLGRWRGLAPTVVTPSFAEALRLLEDARQPEAARSGRHEGAATAGHGADGHSANGHGADGHHEPVLEQVTVPLTGEARAEFTRAHLADLRERTGATVVAVTLDADGALVGDGTGEPCRSHSRPVPASFAVGAGDAYLAAMTLALSAGAALPEATRIAQLAATTTVATIGTCVCRRE